MCALGCWCRCKAPLLCALGRLGGFGAGAAAGCRCCVHLALAGFGAGAAAACAWEVGRWCQCRVPLLGSLGAASVPACHCCERLKNPRQLECNDSNATCIWGLCWRN